MRYRSKIHSEPDISFYYLFRRLLLHLTHLSWLFPSSIPSCFSVFPQTLFPCDFASYSGLLFQLLKRNSVQEMNEIIPKDRLQSICSQNICSSHSLNQSPPDEHRPRSTCNMLSVNSIDPETLAIEHSNSLCSI